MKPLAYYNIYLTILILSQFRALQFVKDIVKRGKKNLIFINGEELKMDVVATEQSQLRDAQVHIALKFQKLLTKIYTYGKEISFV